MSPGLQYRSRLSSRFVPVMFGWAGVLLCSSLILPLAMGDSEFDLLASGAGEVANEAPSEQVPQVADIKALIKNLGDESFSKREQAGADLWRLGELALPALELASASSNPEVAKRAEQLRYYIEAGVLLGSSKEVKQLVLRYAETHADGKYAILKKLTQMGMWKQALHLGQKEKDLAAREKIENLLRETASAAARQALVAGDEPLAHDILKLRGEGHQALIARAWLHCRRGQLKQQLSLAAKMPSQQGDAWRLALFRASGQLESSMQMAKKMELDHLLAMLMVMDGDALPLLQHRRNSVDMDTIRRWGAQIQISKLQGNLKEADALAKKLSKLATNEESTDRVIAVLSANGYDQEALKLLAKQNLAYTFAFYDGTENPVKALALLGINEEMQSPYTDWVSKFSEQVFEDEDEDRYEYLLMLAGFVARHGESEHSIAILKPLMTALEEDGSDQWFELISQMPEYSLNFAALHFMELRGNEDGEVDRAVRFLLGDTDQVNRMWEVLKKRNHLDVEKSLQDLALIAGLLPDPENKTADLNQALLAQAKQKAGLDLAKAKKSIFQFALIRNDIATASRMVDGWAKEEESAWLATKIFLDAALLRWDKAEPVYAEMAAAQPGDLMNLVRWTVCLRKMGREQEAEKTLDQALLLSLGGVQELVQIGLELGKAGYGEEAAELWQQAAIMAGTDQGAYDLALIYLGNFGQPFSDTKQWKKGASVMEICSLYSIQGRSAGAIQNNLDIRFKADFYRGMDLLTRGKKSQRKKAIQLLEQCQYLSHGGAGLADEFFPALRGQGLDREYARWFKTAYQHVDKVCQRYPKAHNSHNTAAWLASRAMLRLDEALKHAEKALTYMPTQGAYLDTMAEVWFAKGNRAKAVKWSEKAVASSIGRANGSPRSEQAVLASYADLSRQLERFKKGPLPKQ